MEESERTKEVKWLKEQIGVLTELNKAFLAHVDPPHYSHPIGIGRVGEKIECMSELIEVNVENLGEYFSFFKNFKEKLHYDEYFKDRKIYYCENTGDFYSQVGIRIGKKAQEDMTLTQDEEKEFFNNLEIALLRDINALLKIPSKGPLGGNKRKKSKSKSKKSKSKSKKRKAKKNKRTRINRKN